MLLPFSHCYMPRGWSTEMPLCTCYLEINETEYLVATNIVDAIQEIHSFMVLKTDITAFDITVR